MRMDKPAMIPGRCRSRPPAPGCRQRLRRGEVVFAGWMQIGHPAVAEVLAGAGFDCLVLDCEHGIIDLEPIAAVLRALPAGCDALVRIPINDSAWIARVLDAGAAGVIVPMVNTAEQAAAAVAAAKYPPRGRRGFGYGRMNAHGRSFDAYAARANDTLAVIVQVEHVQAVENLDAILRTPDVDAIMIGPYDLSGSLGIPGQLDHPKMRQVLHSIYAACRKHRVPAGLHMVQPEPRRVRAALRAGCRFLPLGMDVTLLGHAARDVLATACRLSKGRRPAFP